MNQEHAYEVNINLRNQTRRLEAAIKWMDTQRQDVVLGEADPEQLADAIRQAQNALVIYQGALRIFKETYPILLREVNP